MGRRDPLPRESLVGVQVLVIDDDPEACELLAEVYNWFTEGFDTTDLQEAKTLLDALA